MPIFADDARKVLQDLPIRLPKRLVKVIQVSGVEDQVIGKETTSWLHEIHGDAITGRSRGDVRKELFKEEEAEAEAAADAEAGMSGMGMMDTGGGKIDIDRIDIEVVIEDPPSRAMPRAYLGGLSDVEFSVTSQSSRHCLVASRWEINGSHTGALLGHPATGRSLTITGLTLVRFKPTPDPDGNPGFTAIEELTYWDLPSLLDQLGGTP
jgi:hypothetical protein